MPSAKPPHPMQPIYRDQDGKIRFRENRAVLVLLEKASRGEKCDMNDLASMVGLAGSVESEDLEQFLQLIGYRVSGYEESSLVSEPTWEKVAEAIEALSTLELHGHLLGLAFDQERDRVKAQIDEERKEAMAQHEAEQAAKKS